MKNYNVKMWGLNSEGKTIVLSDDNFNKIEDAIYLCDHHRAIPKVKKLEAGNIYYTIDETIVE